MTPIIPPDLIQNMNATGIQNKNATGLINRTISNATEKEAHQQAQDYTKDIMQGYVARGQESHNLLIFFYKFHDRYSFH